MPLPVLNHIGYKLAYPPRSYFRIYVFVLSKHKQIKLLQKKTHLVIFCLITSHVIVTFLCDASFQISINELKLRDQIFDAGALGNFSLAGFEMVRMIKCNFEIDQMKCKWMRYGVCCM